MHSLHDGGAPQQSNCGTKVLTKDARYRFAIECKPDIVRSAHFGSV